MLFFKEFLSEQSSHLLSTPQCIEVDLMFNKTTVIYTAAGMEQRSLLNILYSIHKSLTGNDN